MHIALFEYVDDYFAAEKAEVAEHAMQCFARVVKALLGNSAIAEDKLECGSSLEVLGVVIKMTPERFTLSPCEVKLKKSLDMMRTALADSELCKGDASKLAGRLQWSTQYLFHRLGRAMLAPIFKASHASNPEMRDDLKMALSWWCRVLEFGIVEERTWRQREAPLAHMFVDACGKSSRWSTAHCPCSPPSML